MAAKPKPVRMLVRMYQVGFGDCFLLTFEYAKPLADGRAQRHVLIDFGSTHGARDRRGGLVPIAKLIRDHTDGQLDAIVISHRHRDHLSAFAKPEIVELLTEKGKPTLVVRSWTEDPDAPADATGSGGRSESARFLAGLNAARTFTERLAKSVTGARSAAGKRLRAAAEEQLKNAEAVQQLAKWAKGQAGEYLHYGQPSRLEEVVPGIKVHVLGPPTVEQHRKVRKNARLEDELEFWMLYRRMIAATPPDALAALGEPSGGEAARRQATAARVPVGPSRWLVDRLASQQANSFLRIVRILDDMLNNTSLILLFEVPSSDGTKRLLFGGDAQIENWEYALKEAPDRAANLRLLEKVDLYKVGHHGSRNATPKTLFKLWEKPANARREMVALMSTTLDADHGSEQNNSEVPRKTLVMALEKRMRLYNTDSIARDVDFVELSADLTNGGRFKKTPAAVR